MSFVYFLYVQQRINLLMDASHECAAPIQFGHRGHMAVDCGASKSVIIVRMCLYVEVFIIVICNRIIRIVALFVSSLSRRGKNAELFVRKMANALERVARLHAAASASASAVTSGTGERLFLGRGNRWG